VNFTPAEAASIAVALGSDHATPLPQAARAALTKVLAAMSLEDAQAARSLGSRLVRMRRPDDARPQVPRVVEQAIVERRVLRIGYRDRSGVATARVIEPVAVVGVGDRWYLTAWCRLRRDLRSFRLDRIDDATLTRERAPERDLPPIRIEGLEHRPALVE
jgi:predicted DNA-binding transcriptional regulator YafY